MSELYLTWAVITEIIPSIHLDQKSYISVQKNASENIVCETAAILFRGRWVKLGCMGTHIDLQNIIFVITVTF